MIYTKIFQLNIIIKTFLAWVSLREIGYCLFTISMIRSTTLDPILNN